MDTQILSLAYVHDLGLMALNGPWPMARPRMASSLFLRSEMFLWSVSMDALVPNNGSLGTAF